MSDDIIPEAPEASFEIDAPDASQPNGSTEAGDRETTTPSTGQARRRRRGSRGGRNRRKKPSAVNPNGSTDTSSAAVADADEAALDTEADDARIVDDDTHPHADPRLTT